MKKVCYATPAGLRIQQGFRSYGTAETGVLQCAKVSGPGLQAWSNETWGNTCLPKAHSLFLSLFLLVIRIPVFNRHGC